MAATASTSTSGRKLFVGPRFRRLRQQLGLSQLSYAGRQEEHL